MTTSGLARRGRVAGLVLIVLILGLTAGFMAARGRGPGGVASAPVQGASAAAVPYGGPEASPDRVAAGDVLGEQLAPDGNVVEAAPPTTPPTTRPLSVCRDSFDPACGDFHWYPAIHNQPVIVSLHVGTEDAAAGEPFPVRISWSDADADSATLNLRACRDRNCIEVLPSVICRAASGRWTPPPSQPGAGHFDALVTLPSAGEWHLEAAVSTYMSGHEIWAQAHGSCPLGDPYASVGGVTQTILVDRVTI